MMYARASVLAGLFLGVMAGACGSTEAAQMPAPGVTPSNAGGTPATVSTVSTVSTVGPAGTSASNVGVPAAGGGSGATGGAAAVVMCGSATCTAPMPLPAVSTVTPVACCVDAATSKCGYAVSGTCTAPAPDAPNCPATMITLGKACCVAASNICGIDATAFGMGCMDILPGAKTMCDGTRVPPRSASAGSSAAAGSSGSAASAGASGTATGGAGGR